MLYVREDISVKLLSHDFCPTESSFVELAYIKRNGSLTALITPIGVKLENILT